MENYKNNSTPLDEITQIEACVETLMMIYNFHSGIIAHNEVMLRAVKKISVACGKLKKTFKENICGIGDTMNIAKKWKKFSLAHKEILDQGFYLHTIFKGTFKIDGKMVVTPVFEYRQERYCENVLVGYHVRYYNRFGYIADTMI
jgi:hypothetical protein